LKVRLPRALRHAAGGGGIYFNNATGYNLFRVSCLNRIVALDWTRSIVASVTAFVFCLFDG
jgi:hypothetical protein